ncbi:MAG: hypothetical protein H0W78_13985 [Planctomycetes bacterium]|jgi:hypothetical protein|nr:hypothetical protein [Planctomycetota bacterium]
MPTIVTVLTGTGLVLQIPVMVVAVVLILAGRQSGPHAGNAALALALPFAVCALVAAVGVLMNLGTGVWSFASEGGRSAGWTWVRWSSVVVLIGWSLVAAIMLLRSAGD